MPLPIKSGFGGKLGSQLDGILEELRSLRPVSGSGTMVSRTSLGSARTVQASASQSSTSAFIALTTVREGLDAVECLDADENTVYVLKPVGFRAYDYYGEGSGSGGGSPNYVTGNGQAYGLDNGIVPNWMTFKTWIYLEQNGASTAATRAIRSIKTVNSGFYADDTSSIGSVFYHIAPFYTLLTSSGATGLPLLAAKVSQIESQLQLATELSTATKLNSTDLSLSNSGDVIADYIDITPRSWEPLDIFVGNVESRVVNIGGFNYHLASFDLTGGSII